MLPTRNPKVIFKALATGAVLYSTEEEVYFGLNPVGVRVWELLPPAHQTLDESGAVVVVIGERWRRNGRRIRRPFLLENGG